MLTRGEHIMTSCRWLSNQLDWPNPAFPGTRHKTHLYEASQMAGESKSSMFLSVVLIIAS